MTMLPPYYPAQSTEPGTIYQTPKGVRTEIVSVDYPWVTHRPRGGWRITVAYQDFFRTYRQVVHP